MLQVYTSNRQLSSTFLKNFWIFFYCKYRAKSFLFVNPHKRGWQDILRLALHNAHRNRCRYHTQSEYRQDMNHSNLKCIGFAFPFFFSFSFLLVTFYAPSIYLVSSAVKYFLENFLDFFCTANIMPKIFFLIWHTIC